MLDVLCMQPGIGAPARRSRAELRLAVPKISPNEAGRAYPTISYFVGYGCAIVVSYPTEFCLVGYDDRAHIPS